MYFENTCRINNNGIKSGYTRRGKVEGDKVTYFTNEKFGDEEDLKRFEPRLLKQEFTNPFLPTSFLIPPKPSLSQQFQPLINHNDINSDDELIKFCEERQKANHFLAIHKKIKEAIREEIHKQLDRDETVKPNTLDDFRFAVEHEKQTGANASSEDRATWKRLKSSYLH